MSKTNAQPIEAETVVLLPVDQCHKSPSQPRRRGDAKPDDDFVASIRAKGVISPIIVRVRKAGGWEIVYGHRRQLGSVMAKRDTIPGIVRDLTDDDVFELQLIENVQRQDMHPLDEADGFKRMVDRGKTAAYIADKIGRPLPYVVQRLKLCELAKEVRAALDKDEISLGVAVLLARIPNSLQAEALDSLYRGMPAAEAKRHLDARYLLRLDQAPFKLDAVGLVPAAGACIACPKRTGQQRELFPDAARADLCIDPTCYRSKLDAVWQIRKKEAAAGGTAVLEGKAADKALSYSGGFKKLNDDEWIDGKRKTIRSLLGKNLPPVTLARDERTGAIAELVKQADVDKVLKRAGARDAYAKTDSQKAQELKARLRAAAIDIAVTSAVDRISTLGYGALVRLMTHALVERSWNDTQMAVSRRRGLEDGKRGTGVEQRLLAALRKMTRANDVSGLGLELALRTVAPGKWSPSKPLWGDTLQALGIKLDAIERQIAAEAKAKKKAKAGKAGRFGNKSPA